MRKLFQEHYTKEEFYLLVPDLRLFDDELFFRYFRMNATKYEQLLAMVAPEIQKSSVTRECIGPSERLCVTLRFLTTGDSQTTIALNHRISLTSVGLSLRLVKPYGKFCQNTSNAPRLKRNGRA